MIKSFWNNTLKKIKQRKKLTLSVIAAFIIISLTIFSINIRESQNLKTAQQIPSSQRSAYNSQTTPAANIPPTINLPKWTTFNGSSFSLQYSPDWTLNQGKISGGGELVTIKPNIV